METDYLASLEKRPGPIIQSDRPWDAFNVIYFSVAEDDGIYKMWYQAYDDDRWNGGMSRREFFMKSARTVTGTRRWLQPKWLREPIYTMIDSMSTGMRVFLPKSSPKAVSGVEGGLSCG